VISKGEQWGWSSPTVLGVTGASLLVLAWWGWYELRRPAPLVNLRASARPAVLLTNLATVLMGYSMFTMFVVTPQILQAPTVTGYGFGSSVLLSGLLLLPIGLAMTIFSPVSARLSQRRGARTTLLVGSLIAAVGNILFAFLHAELSAVVTLVTVTAIGSALAYSALPLLIMSAVPTVETAAANSLNMLMRMFGTAACSAIVVAVTAGITVVTATGRYPSATAYTVTFLLAAAAALGSAALTLFLPGRSRDATPRAGVWRARLVGRFGAHTYPRSQPHRSVARHALPRVPIGFWPRRSY
jgi:predicted MFS family arabinose efflux permease